jgi:hypothetical protein
MGYEKEPMNHSNGNDIYRIEYYEISGDKSDPYGDTYKRYGRESVRADIDDADQMVVDVIRYSHFPYPNQKPKTKPSSKYPDSSNLALLNSGIRTLCIIKIDEGLEWSFNPHTHPFAIHPHSNKEDVQYHDEVHELKSVFSDCRLYVEEADGTVAVIMPSDPACNNGVMNANDELHPSTTWAGFVYDGKKAKKLKKLRKSFEIFLVDKEGNPVGEKHEDEVTPSHPPAWPLHHNDLD